MDALFNLFTSISFFDAMDAMRVILGPIWVVIMIVGAFRLYKGFLKVLFSLFKRKSTEVEIISS